MIIRNREKPRPVGTSQSSQMGDCPFSSISQAGPEAEGMLNLRSRGWYSRRMGDPSNVELGSQSISVKEGHTVTASPHRLHLLSRMLRKWRFESAEMDRSKREQ